MRACTVVRRRQCQVKWWWALVTCQYCLRHVSMCLDHNMDMSLSKQALCWEWSAPVLVCPPPQYPGGMATQWWPGQWWAEQCSPWTVSAVGTVVSTSAEQTMEWGNRPWIHSFSMSWHHQASAWASPGVGSHVSTSVHVRWPYTAMCPPPPRPLWSGGWMGSCCSTPAPWVMVPTGPSPWSWIHVNTWWAARWPVRWRTCSDSHGTGSASLRRSRTSVSAPCLSLLLPHQTWDNYYYQLWLLPSCFLFKLQLSDYRLLPAVNISFCQRN